MKRVSTIIKGIPRITNMTSPSTGQEVPNQFVISTEDAQIFKSYNSNIAVITNDGRILLDRSKWDYSNTTGKYRNQFLGMDKAETEKAIKNGEIKLVDLN